MLPTPVKGRKPKPEGQARNRNPKQTEWIEVLDVPYQGEVPDLPERTNGWSDRTKEKWAVWSAMPHCSLWTEADWEFAIDTLYIAAKFYEGDTKAATELRNREKLLGTTLDFRRDLRIRYVDHMEEKPKPDASNVTDIRDRLSS